MNIQSLITTGWLFGTLFIADLNYITPSDLKRDSTVCTVVIPFVRHRIKYQAFDFPFYSVYFLNDNLFYAPLHAGRLLKYLAILPEFLI